MHDQLFIKVLNLYYFTYHPRICDKIKCLMNLPETNRIFIVVSLKILNKQREMTFQQKSFSTSLNVDKCETVSTVSVTILCLSIWF